VSAAACGGPDVDALLPPFRAELERLAAEAERDDQVAVTGEDGWVFSGPELRHVSAGIFRESETDPLPAIQGFKHQLDDLGIELLLVPVPPKATIYPEKISAALSIPIPVPRLDPAHQEFYDRLRADGIDVLDLTDLFIRDRFHPEGPLYCRTDTHWSGTGCTVAATAIADLVKSLPWYEALDTAPFGAAWYTTTITGDLAGENGMSAGREELRLRGIVTQGQRPVPVAADENSPIVLLGDSHNLVFNLGADLHATGAGLPDQLAFELGLALDVVAVRDSDATPARTQLARRAQTEPGYLAGKRLVIWCFAAGEFTERDGWPLVSIVE
jgi:alginate O-acetyltransferase complex protein AlgJ